MWFDFTVHILQPNNMASLPIESLPEKPKNTMSPFEEYIGLSHTDFAIIRNLIVAVLLLSCIFLIMGIINLGFEIRDKYVYQGSIFLKNKKLPSSMPNDVLLICEETRDCK